MRRFTLRALIGGHPGPSHVYYFDVSFAETVRRHATRPLAAEVTPAEMRSWYVTRDLLGVPGERVIDESSTVGESVATILTTSGLGVAEPRTPCPLRCPHCAEKERGSPVGRD